MLKFVKGHLDSISGIEIYPIISLSIFFIFFALLLVWVFTYSKDKINELSEIPLKEDNQ
jgi:cytochrome c oxidase cbb3-type subunit IV